MSLQLKTQREEFITNNMGLVHSCAKRFKGKGIEYEEMFAAGCVGLAMCFAMMISGFTGAAIPIMLYRFGVDPAVASGPLITTVNDLVAVVSYYGLAWLLLLQLAI